jgi:hypothetical protein
MQRALSVYLPHISLFVPYLCLVLLVLSTLYSFSRLYMLGLVGGVVILVSLSQLVPNYLHLQLLSTRAPFDV